MKRALTVCVAWLSGLVLGGCQLDVPPVGPDDDDGPPRTCADVAPAAFARAWVEDGWSDFSDGQTRGSGADLLVAGWGEILPLHVLDADRDGWPDLVIANSEDDDGTLVDSYVHYGGPDGFSSARRAELPTRSAWSWLLTELDGDGWPDLVFANMGPSMLDRDESWIYFGGPEGFSQERRGVLGTIGPHGVSVGDLNRDGWPDLAFAYRLADHSSIYLGSPAGYSEFNRVDLPTLGANQNAIADFDGDGWLDLVFAQVGIEIAEPTTPLWLYYGGPDGFSPSRRAELPVDGKSHGLSVADLDDDGFLDLVVSVWRSAFGEGDPGFERDSLVFWGSAAGLGAVSSLPTRGAQSNSVADFDRDGHLDIAFSNSATETENHIDSWIYMGSDEGYSVERRVDLPSVSAHGSLAADFDADGWLDLLITNNREDPRRGVGMAFQSWLYHGGEQGFDVDRRTALPTIGAQQGLLRDPGSIDDRRERYEYESSAWDAGGPVRAGTLSFEAELPGGTALRLQVRSAMDEDGLLLANWTGPDGTSLTSYSCSGGELLSDGHHGRRWFQYRAVFTRDLPVYGPILRAVTLTVDPL
jgi:hypothetical protein